jgi:hypothetical protein
METREQQIARMRREEKCWAVHPDSLQELADAHDRRKREAFLLNPTVRGIRIFPDESIPVGRVHERKLSEIARC